MRNKIPKILFHRDGSLIITLMIVMVIVGSITAAVVTMNSSGTFTAIPFNQGLNAYYLAELGFRYSASQYLRTENKLQNDTYLDTSADDEKAAVLEDILNGKTFTLPDSDDKFTLSVYPYYFMAKTNYSNTRDFTVFAPGHLPPGFSVPQSGFLKLDSEDGTFPYSSATVNGNEISFRLQGARIDILSQNEFVYFGLKPTDTQSSSVSNGDDLKLSVDRDTFIPSMNGIINIGLNRTNIFYKDAEFDDLTNVITLKSLFTKDNSNFTISGINTSTDVVFKKFIQLESKGSTGSGAFLAERDINYYVPIGDSRAEQQPLTILMTEKKDVDANFNTDDIQTYSVSQANWDSSSNQVISTSIEKLKQGAEIGTLVFDQKDLIDKIWSSYENNLSYEVQVKMASGVYLMFGGFGISTRLKESPDFAGKYRNYGISFMKYYSPSIGFQNGGTTPIKSGDVFTQHSYDNPSNPVSATATVDGDPIIKSGSWAGGNAKGRLRLKNISAPYGFTENRGIFVNSVRMATLEDDQYLPATGFTDKVPDDIKPPGQGEAIRWRSSGSGCPSASKTCIDNGDGEEYESLLLVLWQQNVDAAGNETRRWLAYKNITYDYCVKGKQSLSVDGRIVNDGGGLSLQVDEAMDTKDGSSVKVNTIKVFYSDTSANYTSRTPNLNRYDYNLYRNRYRLLDGDDPQPTWPPKQLKYWSLDLDKFTMLEKPIYDSTVSNPTLYQWDAINPDVTDMTFFKLEDSGTIKVSDFTTPTSGSYRTNEVGLHAFGDLKTSPYQPAAFVDFSFRVYSPGHSYGGFFAAVQK